MLVTKGGCLLLVVSLKVVVVFPCLLAVVVLLLAVLLKVVVLFPCLFIIMLLLLKVVGVLPLCIAGLRNPCC